MKKLTVRLVIAIITFGVGVAVATSWLVRYRSLRQTAVSVSASATIQSAPPVAPAPNMNPVGGSVPSGKEQPETAIKSEWRGLVRAEFCFSGSQYYSPGQEHAPSAPREVAPGEGFSAADWLPSVKRDKGAVVEFLINQIPDRGKTRAHVCPLDNATRGELAVYCLQHILKVNWPELSEDYSKMFDRKAEEVTSQSLLRGAIKNEEGAEKMMALWRDYYKNGRRE